MEKTINITVDKTDLAAIVSALDFVLIESTGGQFTQDTDTLDTLYGVMGSAFGTDDEAPLAHARALALRLAEVFTKEDE